MFTCINNTSFWAALAVCVFAAILPLFVKNKKVLVATAFGAAVVLLLPGWRTGAMAAFAIGFLWLYLFKWLRWYVPVAALGFAAVLLILKPGSSGGRWFIVKRTVEMIADKPSGIGFGQFAVQYGIRQAAYFRQHGTDGKAALLADNVQFTLNEYLQVIAEGGIAMGVLFALFTLGWLVLGVRLYRKHGTVCGLAAVTGFTALSVCNASFYMLHNWWALLSWGICALTIVLLYWMPQQQVVWLAGAGLALSMAIIGTKTYKVIRDTSKLEIASQLSGMGYRANADSIFKSIDAGNVPNVVYLSAQARHSLLYNDARGAIVLLQKATTYQTHSDVCQLLGLAYLQAGDTAKAIVQFETASYMIPKLFKPRKQLADIYRALHNWEREKYWLESIVRTPIKIPNAASKEIVREARERLGLLYTN
jgi:tetratricopeptide (TPR) repeat protein